MRNLVSSSSHVLRMELSENSYDILIGAGVFEEAADAIARLLHRKRVIIVTDSHVARYHLPALCHALDRCGIAYDKIQLAPGEQTKSFPVLAELMDRLLACAPDRHTTLVALGGGVVGDITGFAASILLRGVDFIQVPTTLLAQVDSSVGGKTGINTRHGKNLIGSFHQPRLVVADVTTLSTLPKREMLAGYAEIVKYGIIQSREFFEWLETYGEAITGGDVALQTEAVLYSCRSKAYIVSHDEKEQGSRALLNFGHTFGHALEAETGFSDVLLHGEAVAVGMVMACAFSAWLGLCPHDDALRVKNHLHAVGLPTSPFDIRTHWSAQSLLDHFYHDKKTQDGALTFILARGIGEAFIAHHIEPAHIVRMLAEVFGIQ